MFGPVWACFLSTVYPIHPSLPSVTNMLEDIYSLAGSFDEDEFGNRSSKVAETRFQLCWMESGTTGNGYVDFSTSYDRMTQTN